MTLDCDELHARAEMPHQEADLSLSEAEARGSEWRGFSDQVAIALRCEAMALDVETEIEAVC